MLAVEVQAATGCNLQYDIFLIPISHPILIPPPSVGVMLFSAMIWDFNMILLINDFN